MISLVANHRRTAKGPEACREHREIVPSTNAWGIWDGTKKNLATSAARNRACRRPKPVANFKLGGFFVSWLFFASFFRSFLPSLIFLVLMVHLAFAMLTLLVIAFAIFVIALRAFTIRFRAFILFRFRYDGRSEERESKHETHQILHNIPFS